MLNFGNLSTSRKPVAFSSPLASTFQTEQHKVVEIVSIVSVCMCIHIYAHVSIQILLKKTILYRNY